MSLWSFLRQLVNRQFHKLFSGSDSWEMDDTVKYRCYARCGHVSFCDGQNLYVWGGNVMNADGDFDTTTTKQELWIYHKNFDYWKCQPCTGSIPAMTSGASCVLILPYAYIICGHRLQHHDDGVYRLHLSTFTWEEFHVQGETISARDKFAAWAYKDKIYCFGGYGPDPQSQNWLHKKGQYVTDQGENNNPWNPYGWNNQLLVLDPATRQWSNLNCGGTWPLPRAAHGAALLGDKVYLFGGRHQLCRMNDLHCLDLPTMTWSGEITTCGPRPEGRSWHTWSAVNDDQIFMYGGFTQTESVLDDAWLFTASTSQWTMVMHHTNHPRLWHTAVVTRSKDVLIFGGCVASISTAFEDPEGFSDQVLRFQLQPSSLILMCLEQVFNHFGPSDWACLPERLQKWLAEKYRIKLWKQRIPQDIFLKMGPNFLDPCEELHIISHQGGGDPGV